MTNRLEDYSLKGRIASEVEFALRMLPPEKVAEILEAMAADVRRGHRAWSQLAAVHGLIGRKA